MIAPILAVLLLRVSLLLSWVPFSDARPNIYPRQSTACGDIYDIYLAFDAYNCLISVPFNATVATELLQYYKDILQFQTTLAYLKDPPSSYQQPPVDLLAGLDSIEAKVNSGAFTNEYDFEVALQQLIYATHDAHIALTGGALNVFTFGSPLRIVSVSSDGIALPEIFVLDDLIESQNESVSWSPSPITAINGIETVKFLSEFAATNAPGTLEPHADWNQLMSSAVGDVTGFLSVFESAAIFYPGENVTFLFGNGSIQPDLPWLATYVSLNDASVVSNGEDFYTLFVLGLEPEATASPVPSSSIFASSTAILPSISMVTGMAPTGASSSAIAQTSATSMATVSSNVASTASSTASSSSSMPSSWDYFPYIQPDVAQPDLGLLNGGVITGYFLNDGETAVLSIPSFDVNGEAVLTFSPTISEFLQQSKAKGYQRVIIDVQKNGGGGYLLATDTFKQFFPSIDPFGGARLRAQPFADALGNTFTTYYTTQDLNASRYDEFSASVWTATTYINADTGRNFSSWPEFFGPHAYNGDLFTTTQRDNLSSTIFDEEISEETLSQGTVVYGFGNRTATSPQPYAAEDIIILSDGYCHSACATFVEMMHHEAGVRTVAIGGRPELGPMQVPAGTRGAQSYSSYNLDPDIMNAQSINSSVAPVPELSTNISFYVDRAKFNLKDNIRRGGSVPLQFTYEAADCRIFYTPRTIYNYLNLWLYVVDAIWKNPSLCIAGSENQLSAGGVTDVIGPTEEEKEEWEDTEPNTLASLILNGFGSVKPSPGNSKVKKRSIHGSKSKKQEIRRSIPKRRDLKAGLKRSDVPELSTEVEDGVTNPSGQCSKCDPPNTCASVKFCDKNNVLQSRQECRKKCSGNADCGPTSTCQILVRGSGFCETKRAIQAAQKCRGGSPGGQGPTPAKAAVMGGDKKLPYSRLGQRPPKHAAVGGGGP